MHNTDGTKGVKSEHRQRSRKMSSTQYHRLTSLSDSTLVQLNLLRFCESFAIALGVFGDLVCKEIN